MIVSRPLHLLIFSFIFLFNNHSFSQENNRIDTILDFKNGKLLLKKNGKMFVSDPNDPNASKLQWDDMDRYADPYYVIKQTYYDSVYSSYDSSWHQTHEYKRGLINKRTGAIFIPPTYDEIREFENGKAIVRVKHKFGMINPEGKLIVPLQHAFILTLQNGNYIMREENAAVFYTKDLKKFNSVSGITSMRPVSGQCLYIIIKDSIAGLMDCDGKVNSYKNWKEIDKIEGNLAYIKGKEGYGVFDIKKQKLLVDAVYRYYEFNQDKQVFFMRKDDSFFIFDTAGKSKGNFKAEMIMRFTNGIYFHRMDKLWGLVNSNGQIIKNPEWTEFEGTPGYNTFRAKKQDGNWKKYNLKGEQLD